MPMLELYAPDKARYSRWIAGISSVLLLGSGVYSLYYAVPESARKPLMGWEPLGDEFPVSLALVSAIVLFVAGAAGTWWGINHKKLVDFFHDTEVEMTKVSWPSRNEVVSSSVVVVATTVILGLWVYLADAVLYGLRTGLLGG